MDCERVSSARLWGLIALTAAATAGATAAAKLSFSWSSALLPLSACLLLTALVWFYRHRRPDARIATVLDTVAQLIAFSAIGAILSYVAAAADRPLWDPNLRAWDLALGLDWRAYLAFVNERPWLGLSYTIVYQSLEVQMILAAVALGFGGKLLECREFVSTFIMAALATILISGFMPAVDMYVSLGLREARDYPNLAPVAAFVHLADLNALRDGAMRVISLKHAQGIITFPSFHAALGVIFAAAFWNLRWLRWPGLVFNLALIASTPIDGGHYFVDVLAGAAIAALSILFVRSLRPPLVLAGEGDLREPKASIPALVDDRKFASS